MLLKQPRVAITGIGVVSAFGAGRDKFWDAIRTGQSGTRAITEFDVSTYPCRVAAPVTCRAVAPGTMAPTAGAAATTFGMILSRSTGPPASAAGRFCSNSLAPRLIRSLEIGGTAIPAELAAPAAASAALATESSEVDWRSAAAARSSASRASGLADRSETACEARAWTSGERV